MLVLTRRPDGAYERAYLPTRENDLRFLAQFLNASGLAAVLLLLLNKHGLIHLWRLPGEIRKERSDHREICFRKALEMRSSAVALEVSTRRCTQTLSSRGRAKSCAADRKLRTFASVLTTSRRTGSLSIAPEWATSRSGLSGKEFTIATFMQL